MHFAVSIPSFRDPSLIATIGSCLTMAKHPRSLSVFVCEQNADETSALQLVDWVSHMGSKIFVDSIGHYEAQGPCYARARIEARIVDSVERGVVECDYIVMIDAHTLFCQDWDVLLYQELRAVPANGVLSCYPKSYVQTKQGPQWNRDPRRTVMEFNGTDANGILLFKQGIDGSARQDAVRPMLSKGLGACFLVIPFACAYEVPYLRDVPYLFIGEEMGTWCRLFMAGYDVFTPTRDIVQTTFSRTGRANFHSMTKKDDALHKSSLYQVAKLKTFMGLGGKVPVTMTQGEMIDFEKLNRPKIVVRTQSYFLGFVRWLQRIKSPCLLDAMPAEFHVSNK